MAVLGNTNFDSVDVCTLIIKINQKLIQTLIFLSCKMLIIKVSKKKGCTAFCSFYTKEHNIM